MTPKNILTAVVLLVAPLLSSAKDKNYKYTYKASCNCIISSGNPKGIEQVTVYTYKDDPDVHMVMGYYHANGPAPADTLSLTDFSPKKFQCYPCVTLQTGVNYVLYFPGKPEMERVEVKFHKSEKGAIVIDK